MGKLWGIAALTALSLTACGGDMGYRDDGGTLARDGTLSGGVYDDGLSDNGVTNRNGLTDNGVTNRNGLTDGATDFGDTARRYDYGDTERSKDTVTDRDGNAERSMLERASDALEDGIDRARDGVENARERVSS